MGCDGNNNSYPTEPPGLKKAWGFVCIDPSYIDIDIDTDIDIDIDICTPGLDL